MNLAPDELPEALQHRAPTPDPRRYDYIQAELREHETRRRLRALRRFAIGVAVVAVMLALVGAWRWL